MTYKCRDVESSLEKKGFRKELKDHNVFVLYVDGERTKVRTKTIHNGQDIDKGLAKKMSNQVHLSKDDFNDLIQCPLSKEKYIEILTEENIIVRNK